MLRAWSAVLVCLPVVIDAAIVEDLAISAAGRALRDAVLTIIVQLYVKHSTLERDTLVL